MDTFVIPGWIFITFLVLWVGMSFLFGRTAKDGLDVAVDVMVALLLSVLLSLVIYLCTFLAIEF